MIERLVTIALIPAWTACTVGWAGWVAFHTLHETIFHLTMIEVRSK